MDYIARHHELTPRQRQITSHIQDGKRTKEIARLLGLSPATVKCHLSAIFLRLDIPNRCALAGLRLAPSAQITDY